MRFTVRSLRSKRFQSSSPLRLPRHKFFFALVPAF